jgi:hypothetical protein
MHRPNLSADDFGLALDPPAVFWRVWECRRFGEFPVCAIGSFPAKAQAQMTRSSYFDRTGLVPDFSPSSHSFS